MTFSIQAQLRRINSLVLFAMSESTALRPELLDAIADVYISLKKARDLAKGNGDQAPADGAS